MQDLVALRAIKGKPVKPISGYAIDLLNIT